MKKGLGFGGYLANSSEAFTLIELLIVIAVLAVLVGVVLVNFNPFSWGMKSRDAMRIQNLEDMHRALALGIANNEVRLAATAAPCGDCSSATGTRAVDGTGWIKFAIPLGKNGLAKYLPALFIDPLNDDPYVYTFASTENEYELNAVLESPDNAARMSTDGGNAQQIFEIGTSLTLL